MRKKIKSCYFNLMCSIRFYPALLCQFSTKFRPLGMVWFFQYNGGLGGQRLDL